MNSVRSNNESLKYQRFATLGSKDIEILNSEFVAKTQFLFIFINQRLFYVILELCITFNTGQDHFKPVETRTAEISLKININRNIYYCYVINIHGCHYL